MAIDQRVKAKVIAKLPKESSIGILAAHNREQVRNPLQHALHVIETTSIDYLIARIPAYMNL